MSRWVLGLALGAGLVAPSSLGPAWAAETITFGIITPSSLYWPIFVGKEKGFYERNGIALDLVFTGSSPAATQALTGGSLNVTAASTDAAFTAQQKVPEMRQIFSLLGKLPYSLVVTPEITRVEDLRGKVTGGSSAKTGDAYILRSVLDAYGLKDGRDYTLVVAGPSGARAEAMQRGVLQGTPLFEPQVSFLKDKGMVELLRADAIPRLKDYPFLSVVAMQPWVRAHEDAALRFGRATAEATQWLYDPRNRGEAVQILVRTVKVPEKYAENSYRALVEELQVFPRDLRLTLAGLRKVLENMLALGDLKPPLPDLEASADFSLVEKLGRR